MSGASSRGRHGLSLLGEGDHHRTSTGVGAPHRAGEIDEPEVARLGLPGVACLLAGRDPVGLDEERVALRVVAPDVAVGAQGFPWDRCWR